MQGKKKKIQSGNSIQNSKMSFPSLGTGHENNAKRSAAQLQRPRWALRPPCLVAWREGCTHVPSPPACSSPVLIRCWGVCRKLSRQEETGLASA